MAYSGNITEIAFKNKKYNEYKHTNTGNKTKKNRFVCVHTITYRAENRNRFDSPTG